MSGYLTPKARLAGTPDVVASAAVPTYDALRRSDLFTAVGVCRSYDETQVGNDSSARSLSECAGSASANAQFGTHIIAIPEIMPVSGTISALGFYGKMTIVMSRWLGCFADTIVNGNHFPGASLNGTFEKVYSGAGDNFVSGVVSVAVTTGDLIWFVTQVSNTNAGVGYRDWKNLRALFGDDVSSPIANNLGTYNGIYTATPRTYNAALSTFPADGALMPCGLINLGVPGGAPAPNTHFRPSSYYKLTF